MKNKRGNVAVIAIIIVIVAITTGVITWLIATKTQAPVQQAIVPVTQTQQKSPAQLETQPAPNQVKNNPNYVFDMADVAKFANPMTNESEPVDKGVQKTRTDFYNDLKNNNIADAIVSLKKLGITSIFPETGNANPIRAAVSVKNGIALLIFEGNGYPSVPNDSYYFGYIVANGNKIELYQSLIKHYFDGSLGVEYKNGISGDYPSAGFDRAVKIMDQIEAETKKGLETGSFANATIQTEYNEFISSLK